METEYHPQISPDFVSRLEWTGHKGKVVTLKERKHFGIDHVESQPGSYLPFISKRRITGPKAGDQYFTPSLRVKYDKLYETQELEPQFARKLIRYPIKNLDRHQKTHYKPQISESWENHLGGIRSFSNANCPTTGEVFLEKTINRKKKLTELAQLRNFIPCHSLGDKIYRSPTYAENFFKGDGLIPGSTNIFRKKTTARLNEVDFTTDKNVKWP
jgi:hypothetical protein